MLRIDAHSHVGEGAAVWTGRQVVERMDTIGIDKTVVFPFTEGSFNNEQIPGYINEFPDRLIPYCAINPWDKQTALDELDRRLSEGFKGVKLHPTICGFPLSSKSLCNPVFEIVQAHGAVVITHAASDMHNSPLECGRMAARFPKVPLIMAHCGFFWQWEQAIEVAQENDNIYLETSRVPLFETRKIIAALGGGKVMWGTDGPFADYAWEFDKVRKACSSEDQFDMVAGGTIAGLLNIK